MRRKLLQAEKVLRRHRTQTPIETLNRGWGSCRDVAVLLIEAARGLGFGARVVTGYLYNPSAADGHTTAVTGAGTTHAWADIYLPGAGWIAYDPTNGTIGGGDLIRVAVTRDISQPRTAISGLVCTTLLMLLESSALPQEPGVDNSGRRREPARDFGPSM